MKRGFRVVMLCDYPVPGFEFGTRQQPTPVINLVEGLIRSGVKVQLEVVTTRVEPGTGVPRVYELDATNAARLWVVPVPPRSGASKFYLPRVWRLLKMIRRLDPDLVHAQGVESEFPLAAVSSGVPAILTPHGIPAEYVKVNADRLLTLQRVLPLVARFTTRRAAAMVAISPHVKTTRDARWFDIPNPVGECFFDQAMITGERSNVFLAVGTICELKGTLTIVEAAKRMTGISGKLVLIGDAFTPDDRAYMARCKELAAQPRGLDCEFIGWQRPEVCAALMRDAAAVIIGSRAETAPMVAAEAWATGTRVIATPVGAMATWLSEAPGVLVEIGNPSSIEAAMRQMMGGGGPADAKKCREFAQRFRTTNVVRSTLEMYAEFLQNQI